VTTLRAKNVES